MDFESVDEIELAKKFFCVDDEALTKKLFTFKLFEAGKRVSFDVWAFFIPKIYALYNRLYSHFFALATIELILIAIPKIILISIGHDLHWDSPEELRDKYVFYKEIFPYWAAFVHVILMVFYGTFVNFLVYKRFKKYLHRIGRSDNFSKEEKGLLAKKAGVYPTGFSLLLSGVLATLSITMFLEAIRPFDLSGGDVEFVNAIVILFAMFITYLIYQMKVKPGCKY